MSTKIFKLTNESRLNPLHSLGGEVIKASGSAVTVLLVKRSPIIRRSLSKSCSFILICVTFYLSTQNGK